jgi:hypothetical protein
VQAAGNPLYVRELVDAMVRERALEIGPAAARSAAGARLPASLAAVLTDRLGSVSAGAAQLLRTAALLGGRFAVTDLAVVLRRPVSELAADGDPEEALGAVREVLNGTVLVIGYGTVVEAQLLAGLAYRALGDRCAADQSTERALALAEADRLMLPFAMTGSRELLEALPRHQTADAALLTDILSGYGRRRAPRAGGSPGVAPGGQQSNSARASSGCCATSRPTCPGRRSPPSCRCR